MYVAEEFYNKNILHLGLTSFLPIGTIGWHSDFPSKNLLVIGKPPTNSNSVSVQLVLTRPFFSCTPPNNLYFETGNRLSFSFLYAVFKAFLRAVKCHILERGLYRSLR